MLKPAHLDRAWIARHIPHQGSMCLLDHVDVWDEQHIECRAETHRAPGNPLRAFGRLGAACGVEYAAQAMAVHGQLLASAGKTTAGVGACYLAGVRDLQLRVQRLDDIAADLEVTAECVARSERTVLYRFNLTAAGTALLTGRATVVIDAGLSPSTTGDIT